jgi:hypothetical protein
VAAVMELMDIWNDIVLVRWLLFDQHLPHHEEPWNKERKEEGKTLLQRARARVYLWRDFLGPD